MARSGSSGSRPRSSSETDWLIWYLSRNSQETRLIDSLTRRTALKASAGLVGGLAMGAGSSLMAATKDQKPDVSAAAVPVAREFPAEVWNQTPWQLDVKAPFDLDDEMGGWHALMKGTQNLVGARTYVSNYSRVYLCEQDKQAEVFYGSAGCWTYQDVVPKPDQFPEFGELPKDTALHLGLYTGVVLDPYTFKPVQEVYNPFLDKKVTVEDSVFAESYLLYPGGGMSSVERRQFMDDRAPKKHVYVRSGNSLSWNFPALFAGEGSFQPRMDSSWWTCKYDELMNPELDLIDCDYSWVGLTRVGEKKWWGMSDVKNTVLQTLWNTRGTVTNKLSNVEGIVQEYVFSKYPDRI